MTQQSHYWAYTLRKPQFKKAHGRAMFIAEVFIIDRTWKQSRCLLTNEWLKKLWYVYTMEYYSAIKRNEFELVRWMNLELLYRMK